MLSPSRITSDVMNTKCSIRGGFRGEAKAPPPPPPTLSSGSGIFWDNVLEWYMNLYEPTDSR